MSIRTVEPEQASASCLPVPLIDRHDEARALRAALDDALAGNGRVVLIGGEPGIGKTRLASFFAGEAEGRGVPVWWGRAWEDGSAPAFWPWNTALRRWLDRAGHETVGAAAGAWGGELAHVFPVLRDRISDLPTSESWQSDGARFRLFDLVSQFLAAVAKPAGLVVVLDDVHWADPASLKLLEFVAADLAYKRLLIIVTYRDTEIEREGAFFTTLARLGRESSTRRLPLGGLSPEDCARWISLAGVRGDSGVLGELLHRETNGNPLFVGELVHRLVRQPDADWTVLRVPEGVQEAIARRLFRLGTECRKALSVAALCGDTFEAGMLGEIFDDVHIADRLELAVRDRVLFEVEERPGQYGFAHGIIRRVLVDELPASQRAAWHARIAAVLERQAANSEVATTELVRHLAAAGTAESLRKAFTYAGQGAVRAIRALGWEEAVRLSEIALDVGGRSCLLDARRAVELRLTLARALRGAGDVAAARAVCEEVIDTCRRMPDPEAFARAALIHAGPIPEWGRVEPAVRAILEEASRCGTALDDGLRARLYARLAGDLVSAGEIEQADRIFHLFEEAAAAARRADAPGALAIALVGTHMAELTGLRPVAADAEARSREALAAAEAGGEHEYAAAIRYLRAMTFFANDEPDAFSSEVDAVATGAAASRVPEALWLADALAAVRAIVQGKFAEGREAMERALATGRRAQLPTALGVYAGQRLMWYVLQGRLGEVAAELEAFVDAHPMGAGLRPFRALARLACGDVVAARVEFHRLLAAGMVPAERGVMWRTYLVGLAALCIALRDREHAPLLYEAVERCDEAWSIGGGQTLGPWALLLGSLARLCDRSADAIRHFEEAIRLARRVGSPAFVARAQSMLASLRLSLQPDAAQRASIASLLAEAGQCARELGLVDVEARVARLQAKLPRVDVSANTFRRDGDVWTVRFAGCDLRLKDGKGPRYLATLLAAPGREVHVLEFLAPAEAPCGAAFDGLSVGPLQRSLDDAPDERARNEYRARIADLREELDEAERFADDGRAERIRAELDALVAQLAQQFGSRRRAQGAAETARKAVTKVLRTQIGRILDVHPPLGRHLRDTIRMGKVCVYAPPAPVDWDVRFDLG